MPERITILVVDDEPLVRSAIAEELRDQGAVVVEAVSGDEAWAYIQAQDVDMVFTDHRMPGRLQGADLAAMILSHYPHTQVILASGYYDGPALPVELLLKPYNLNETAGRLLRLCRERKGRAAP